jgi:hypothetical protein
MAPIGLTVSKRDSADLDALNKYGMLNEVGRLEPPPSTVDINLCPFT